MSRSISSTKTGVKRMKIRLLILSDDKLYTQRISIALAKYSSTLELYMFEDLDAAYNCISKTEIDIFASERHFKVELEKLSPYCTFAYFVDDASVTQINECYAIGKFQSVDATYKRITELYSSVSGRTIEKIKSNRISGSCKTILFTSFSGGIGTTSMAVAAAIEAAQKGLRILYLNLEDIPTTNIFFKQKSSQNFSKVIYALKSEPNKNIQLKLDSLVTQDETGVFFYNEPDTALDMNELNWDDINNLLKQLSTSGTYDIIITDKPFNNNSNFFQFESLFDHTVIVCDGSQVSNHKATKAVEMIKIFEQGTSLEILSKMIIAYNKFSNKTSKEMTAGNLRDLEGVPRLEHATSEEVINHILNRRLFATLF